MEFRHILVLVALLFSADAFAQAYRWVDENGVVHYSDRPQPGAEEINLPDSNAPAGTPRPLATPRASTTDASTEPNEEYSGIDFTSPVAEETLWNIGGVLDVELALTPRLRAGHKIRIYLDGEPRDMYALFFRLTEVWRGEHTIQAEVLDQNDELLIRSETVRFYVQQTSVLSAPGAARPQTAP